MPASRSTIRTVPGGNSEGPDVPAAVDGLPIGASFRPEPPTSAATSTTTTRASAPSPSSHRVRLPDGASTSLVISSSSDSHGAGPSSGMAPTATPGPAGVATSDQPAPFHQRTMPGAPSGSAYQPGGGGDGAVMRPR